MPTPPIMVVSPGTCEVVLRMHAAGTDQSKDSYNVLHYWSNGLSPFEDSQVANFLTAFDAQVAAPWANVFSITTVTCTSVTGRYMEDSSRAKTYWTTPGDFDGSYTAGDFQPSDSSWFIQKLTQGSGKSLRGGVHMSPIPEAGTANFRITDGFKAIADNLVTNLMAPITWAAGLYNMQPFLVSRKYSTLVPSGLCTIVGCPISSMRVRKNLGSMKSRKTGTEY